MATFLNIRTTDAGQALLADVHAGNEELTITHIAFGDGKWEEADHDAMSLTALKHEVIRVEPSGGKQDGGEAELTCVLTNTKLVTGFALTEVGVIAERKDKTQVLYMADAVPIEMATWVSSKDDFRVEIPVILRIVCSSTSDIEIRVESTSPLTGDDLKFHNKAEEAHVDIRKKLATHTHSWVAITGKPLTFPPSTHTHTPSQVGLGNIPNAKSDSVTSISSMQLATSKAAKTAYDKALAALRVANEKAPLNHNHHSLYYTQAQVDAMFSNLVIKPAGHIELMPFGPDALPQHHYMLNGEGLLRTSSEGKRLRSMPSQFKTDWGITENPTHIFLPNVFSGSDGYFFRPVNGSSRKVGSKQSDAIRNMTGTVTNIKRHTEAGSAGSGVFKTYDRTIRGDGGEWRPGINFDFDASRVVPTSHENRPKNIGMTPVIYLPPL